MHWTTTEQILLKKTDYGYFQENRFTLHTLNLQGQAAADTISIALSHNPALAASLEEPNKQSAALFSSVLDAAGFLLRNPNPAMHKDTFAGMEATIQSGYALFDVTNHNLSELLTLRMQADRSSRSIMLILVLSAVSAGLVFTFITGRGITRAIEQANQFAAAIAEDKLDNEIVSIAQDEPGQLLRALALMQEKLRHRITEERKQAISNGRIKQALECVSSVVLVADVKDNIIYCNNAGNDYFRTHESALAKDIEGFSFDTLIGQPVDLFCKTENVSINVEGNSSVSKKIDRLIGGRHIAVTASAVHDEQSQAIGTVIELNDRSKEVAIEQAAT